MIGFCNETVYCSSLLHGSLHVCTNEWAAALSVPLDNLIFTGGEADGGGGAYHGQVAVERPDKAAVPGRADRQGGRQG